MESKTQNKPKPIRKMTVSGLTFRGKKYFIEEFVTDQEPIRILKVELEPGNSKWVSYNPYKEEFNSARDRLVKFMELSGISAPDKPIDFLANGI